MKERGDVGCTMCLLSTAGLQMLHYTPKFTIESNTFVTAQCLWIRIQERLIPGPLTQGPLEGYNKASAGAAVVKGARNVPLGWTGG